MNANTPRICVIGSAMGDQIARAERLPNDGETLVGTSYTQGFGGKGSNQAVMAARLGAQVFMVAKLGRDALGEATLSNYRAQNIATETVFFDDELPSGVAPIWVDEATGQNRILIIPGANEALTIDEVRSAQSAIAGSDVVVCQNEIPLSCDLEAFRIAKAAEKITIYNPAPALDVPDELLQLCDIVVPNEHEAALLTNVETATDVGAERAARAIQARGAKSVVLTLGERGALIVDETGAHRIHAQRVQAVDTTGAGDAFVGALAYFLARGESLRDGADKACRVATRSVLQHGTQTSFPFARDLAELL